MPIPLAAVVGPTATGKSALAVELALRCGGEIINADSMQVYAGMDIATAKPTEAERRGVPHHLLGFLPLSESYSVVRFQRDARACIDDIRSRGKLPILCGGTGLYIDAVLDDVDFTPMEAAPGIRAALELRAAEEGADALWAELARVDPETAAAVHPRNVTRVIRALEVYGATGETLSAQRARSRLRPSPYDVRMVGLDFEDRGKLYARIDVRVDRMLADGLVEECRACLAEPLSDTAAQAIGCKELAPYFAGLLPLETCVENLKMSTRRYAKRQRTWFRRDPRVYWLYPDRIDMYKICEKAKMHMVFCEPM